MAGTKSYWKGDNKGFHTVTDKALPSIGHPASTTLIREGSKADTEHFTPSRKSAKAKYKSEGIPEGKAERMSRNVGADVATDFAEVQSKTGRFLETGWSKKGPK